MNSFWIYVNVPVGKDRAELLAQVASTMEQYENSRVIKVPGAWLEAQKVFYSSISSCPNDWFVVADLDEFQLYPADLPTILAQCDRSGFDHIKGCFVDRIAADGSLPVFEPRGSIWDQYPIGAHLTGPVCKGITRKVVAAKGSVRLSSGHHFGLSGHPTPISQLFVEVHHFKWVAGVLDYLYNRVSVDDKKQTISTELEAFNKVVSKEGLRFLRYFELAGNRIDLAEPGLLAAKCNPHYPHWDVITHICMMEDLTARVNILRQRSGQIQRRL